MGQCPSIYTHHHHNSLSALPSFLMFNSFMVLPGYDTTRPRFVFCVWPSRLVRRQCHWWTVVETVHNVMLTSLNKNKNKYEDKTNDESDMAGRRHGTREHRQDWQQTQKSLRRFVGYLDSRVVCCFIHCNTYKLYINKTKSCSYIEFIYKIFAWIILDRWKLCLHLFVFMYFKHHHLHHHGYCINVEVPNGTQFL